jgi:hypothetical protein
LFVEAQPETVNKIVLARASEAKRRRRMGNLFFRLFRLNRYVVARRRASMPGTPSYAANATSANLCAFFHEDFASARFLGKGRDILTAC